MSRSNISPRVIKRALLMGAFSTVGDVEVLHEVERRLSDLGVPFDVSPLSEKRTSMFEHWVHASRVDPQDYSHVFFVCGPLTRKIMEKRWHYLKRFQHCVFVGVNLTMVADTTDFNPFEVLIERDSDRSVRPDMSFAQSEPRVPVVGICLAPTQKEYGDRQRHTEAKAHIERLAQRSGVAAILVDTHLAAERDQAVGNGFFNPSQFESAISRFDALLTTRLHGLVLALKNSVPVVAIDAIKGGDKVSRQAAVIGWPEVFDVSEVTEEDLDRALERCLKQEARERAAACANRARQFWEGFEGDFERALEAVSDPALRADLKPRQGMRDRIRYLGIRGDGKSD
ncbi:polysaccharide pyruvyl transferase family protein [Oricola indica]|uniref:polysaccharide pyruvyl transferase family protein n=1 Tax=Oricola indica TaxID=2872591 RepID=UPI003CCBCD0F